MRFRPADTRRDERRQSRVTQLDTDEIGGLVLPEKVHRRIYTDPGLFDLEMERIFGRVWMFVGHESQVPEPGDWIKSRIGTRRVLLTRDREGEIHVLRNQCSHRGMAVCGGERGGGQRLVCPYHGWGPSTSTARSRACPIRAAIRTRSGRAVRTMRSLARAA
jgi:nitrite reductase/ring-hydroxylating ferredoxin subunit